MNDWIKARKQSAYTQYFEEVLNEEEQSALFDRPFFMAERGGKCRVVEGFVVANGRDQGRLKLVGPSSFDGEEVLTWQGTGEFYNPFRETPNLYRDFAKLGEPQSERSLRVSVTKFVERYGLPLPDATVRTKATQPLGSLHMRLQAFIDEASKVAIVLKLVAAVGIAESKGTFALLNDLPGLEGLTRKEAKHRVRSVIARLLREGLRGAVLWPLAELDSEGLVGGYSCEKLLTAVWIQVYEAALGKRVTHAVCANAKCGRSLAGGRKGRLYCDKSCRNAQNQRNYMRSKAKVKTSA